MKPKTLDMENYMTEAFKKAYILWITEVAEPNNTHLVKTFINDLLTFEKFHPLEKYEKLIYSKVSKRLFKNKIPPNDIIKLAKLKLPMLIEISSNNT